MSRILLRNLERKNEIRLRGPGRSLSEYEQPELPGFGWIQIEIYESLDIGSRYYGLCPQRTSIYILWVYLEVIGELSTSGHMGGRSLIILQVIETDVWIGDQIIGVTGYDLLHPIRSEGKVLAILIVEQNEGVGAKTNLPVGLIVYGNVEWGYHPFEVIGKHFPVRIGNPYAYAFPGQSQGVARRIYYAIGNLLRDDFQRTS